MPLFNVFKSLGNSEKAVTGGLLVGIATYFVFAGEATIAQWMDYTEILFGTYVAGKTVQGATTAMATRRSPQIVNVAATADPVKPPPLPPAD